MDLVALGSATAKGGFANERTIAIKFNNWTRDNEATLWLRTMGYNIKRIEKVEAIVLSGHKTDVQVQITVFMKKAISKENLSIKKANSDADYNQIDKRWVDKYAKLWNVPNNVVKALKMFTGEIPPKSLLRKKEITKVKYQSLKDKRRFFLTELKESQRNTILNFFKENKLLIVADLLKGRGRFAADWMLVTKYNKTKNETSWVLKSINETMNVFGKEEVRISSRGSLYIGKITMQRKGGDAGKPTSKMLQFKIKPCELF